MRKTGCLGGGRNKWLPRTAGAVALMLGGLTWYEPVSAQQMTPDQRAATMLNAGRAAYNDRNYDVAAERFRAILKEFGGRREGAQARYGLALVLLEGPNKDYNGAVEMLQPVVSTLETADRPYGHYYFGLALRGLALQALEKAASNPNQAQPNIAAANQRLDQAAQQFAAGAAAFAAMVKDPIPADAKALPAELEWANRCRCDHAEVLLRRGRIKEVLAAMEPWAQDPPFAKSQYRAQAAYQMGYAQFLLKDYVAAGKWLASLAPFDQPMVGAHARYLLARTHHIAGEVSEAAAGYEAVLAGYAKDRKAAEDALKNQDALKTKPLEKASLEAIVRGPAPEYVGRTQFYYGVLLQEQDKLPEAQQRLTVFLQQNPKSAVAPEAQLRLGMTLAQMRQYPQAMQTLNPLQEHPALADQALLWIARSQAGSADANNAQAYQQAMNATAQTLHRASDKARALYQADPDAKIRRGEILMELADVQQRAGQYKEAIATYATVLGDAHHAAWAELATERQAVAMQLAGMYAESDQVCQRFLAAYPRSLLLPEIHFRYAENAFLSAAAIETSGQAAAQAERMKQLYGEAITRYKAVVEKYPDFAHVNLARQGMGMSHYRLGQYAQAAKVLNQIPPTERGGEMATAAYLLADCMLRTLPQEATDAIAAARLMGQLNDIIFLLDMFANSQEKHELAPDAMVKLGFALQKSAEILADPVEQRKQLARCRLNYNHFAQTHPRHPLFAVVVFENAKVLATLGDPASAARELSRFTADPLKSSPMAPLALIKLADYMRLQKRPQDALNVLTQVKQQHEEKLKSDPAKIEWVLMLQYTHGLVLKDLGKTADARAAFEHVMKQYPDRREATESVWRLAQTQREEALAQLDAARKAISAAGGNKDSLNAAQQKLDDAAKGLRLAADQLAAAAEPIAKKPGGEELRPRVLYEAAWCNRMLGEMEVQAVREKLQAEAMQKLREKVAAAPAGRRHAVPRPPAIALSAIPLQPAESRARDNYKTIIESSPDSPLANDARVELADLLVQRESHDGAIELLAEAMDNEPTPDLIYRIRLRLGGCFLAKGDPAKAMPQFEPLAQLPRGSYAIYAKFGMGECFILQQNWTKAIETLTPFRDNSAYRAMPGTTDRALARLGLAYAQLGQWDPSRQAYEVLVNRFPYSPWNHDARYGIGQALQHVKQYDAALIAYQQVVNATGTELGAQAQLQIGLCRMEQKKFQEAARALLVVPYSYDYPELTAAAWCEAARAFVELKQPEEAKKALQQVIQEHPQGPWNELAKKRLAEIS